MVEILDHIQKLEARRKRLGYKPEANYSYMALRRFKDRVDILTDEHYRILMRGTIKQVKDDFIEESAEGAKLTKKELLIYEKAKEVENLHKEYKVIEDKIKKIKEVMKKLSGNEKKIAEKKLALMKKKKEKTRDSIETALEIIKKHDRQYVKTLKKLQKSKMMGKKSLEDLNDAYKQYTKAVFKIKA